MQCLCWQVGHYIMWVLPSEMTCHLHILVMSGWLLADVDHCTFNCLDTFVWVHNWIIFNGVILWRALGSDTPLWTQFASIFIMVFNFQSHPKLAIWLYIVTGGLVFQQVHTTPIILICCHVLHASCLYIILSKLKYLYWYPMKVNAGVAVQLANICLNLFNLTCSGNYTASLLLNFHWFKRTISLGANSFVFHWLQTSTG